MYEPIVNSSYLDLGTRDDTAVVIGWYPLSKFKSKVPSNLYAVAGNLFSKKIGVNGLIRNLLHNERIKNLLILRTTQEDTITSSCDYLIEVPKGQIPLSEINIIDAKFTEDSFNHLVEDLNVKTFTEIGELKDELHRLTTEVKRTSERIRCTLPVNSFTSDKLYPNDPQGHLIRADSIEEGYYQILERIRLNGLIVDGTQELLNLTVSVKNESSNLTEFLNKQSEEVKNYCLNFLFGTNSKDNYGYGDRLISHFGFNQIEKIINKLRRKSTTRAAQLQVWEPKDLIQGNSPCLTQIWCRVINRELHIYATFRSNDMFRAWKSNISALHSLQLYICDQTTFTPATINTISLSAHIYKECFSEIDAMLKQRSTTNERKIYYSHCGNFVFELDNQLIVVTQLDHDGRIVDEYKNTNVGIILGNIIRNNPTIEPGHLVYLTRELDIIEACRKLKIAYVQDKLSLCSILKI